MHVLICDSPHRPHETALLAMVTAAAVRRVEAADLPAPYVMDTDALLRAFAMPEPVNAPHFSISAEFPEADATTGGTYHDFSHLCKLRRKQKHNGRNPGAFGKKK